MPELKFNFDKTMTQVNELNRIASDMTDMNSHSMTEAVRGIQGGWKGSTSQQFLKKCNELKALIEAEASNIRKVADSLENSAHVIETAERAAAEAAARTAAVKAAAAKLNPVGKVFK